MEGERQGFSWQSHTLVVGGRRAGVLMAVTISGSGEGGGSHGSPEAGSEGEMRGFTRQSQMLVVGGRRWFIR